MKVIVECEHCMGHTEKCSPSEVLILHNATWDTYTYKITCKRCNKLSVLPLREDRLEILKAIGVPLQHWTSPSLPDIVGPPIDLTDLAKFKEELNEL
jgi:hypothetical protein